MVREKIEEIVELVLNEIKSYDPHTPILRYNIIDIVECVIKNKYSETELSDTDIELIVRKTIEVLRYILFDRDEIEDIDIANAVVECIG